MNLTLEQSNYLHSKMRDLETEIKAKMGLDIHLGIYRSSKRAMALLGPAEAISVICEKMAVPVHELKGKSRSGYLVDARTIVCAVLRAQFRMSTTDMGRLLNRDHTTIMNLLNKATDLTNAGDSKYLSGYQIALEALQNKEI